MSITENDLIEGLKRSLEVQHVEVIDSSGGCGQSFEVTIVSPDFEGKTLIQRHRLVNDALKDEIAKLHAFTQKTLTPQQWEERK